MDYFTIHSFSIEKSERITIQNNLRKRIRIESLKRKPEYISGVDVVYSKDKSLAVIVTFDYVTLKIVEFTYAIEINYFDYEAGFLAFHELPAFLKAWLNLSFKPDIVVFDGYGYTHPRRMGLATHASFFIQKPTFGIAKSHFIGNNLETNSSEKEFNFLVDNDEIIGIKLFPFKKSKPIFISVGNYITLDESIEITKRFLTGYSRIPLLTAIPDKLSKKLNYLLK